MDMGISPARQVQLIEQGHHVLPVFALNNEFDKPVGVDTNPAFYEPLRAVAEKKLPFVLSMTQFEQIFYQNYAHFSADDLYSLLVPATAQMFPFADAPSLALWRKAGRLWAQNPDLRMMFELYPEPQRVFILSNNEWPRVEWHEAIALCDSIPRICDFLQNNQVARISRASDLDPWSDNNEKLRRAMAAAWGRHYQALFDGFREGLPLAWRDAVQFVGYEDFLSLNYGYDTRSDTFVYPEGWTQDTKNAMGYIQKGWLEDGSRSVTMHAGNGNVVPWARIWSGNSASFYHYENTNNLAYSHLVKMQGLTFALDDIFKYTAPNYWFEVSTWNWFDYYGMPTAPDTLDRLDGYEGQLQMQLWLLQPRAARFFHLEHTAVQYAMPYFERTMSAVDRVWANDTLSRFWRDSELVSLEDVTHPFTSEQIPGFESSKRWYFLRNNLDNYLDGGALVTPCYYDDASRKWIFNLHPTNPVYAGCPNDIRSFAVARQRGVAPNREWLIYAFTPVAAAADSQVTFPNYEVQLPGYGPVTFGTLSRRGGFVHVKEGEQPRPITD